MRILISGASGLIGTALVELLKAERDLPVPLVRSTPRPGSLAVRWDPASGVLPAAELEGYDAVVHLAGEGVAGGRWNAARKERIRRSRVEGTGLLCRTLATLRHPPGTLVCASAIGYYGDRGDEDLVEESGPGADFLAGVVAEWEAAADPARAAGIRVVHLRLGQVLSPSGGALARMLLPFRLGLGGRVGSGRQYWSWISLNDAVAAARHCLVSDGLRGPVNGTAPEPVTNAEFARALGRALRRPALLPVPAAVVRLLFGEMGQALLLGSARVLPRRLLAAGYAFAHPTLDRAFGDMLHPDLQG
ncbi:MAG: TIGR01777 family oxidoreductase [Gemmatimonadota bacterium]